ncbi:MAG: dihydroorotase [Gammaproteobacteria bacterium]
MTDTLTITRPDDWHLHFRDGAALRAVVPPTAQVFGRAICMPNLVPPVTTSALAGEYRARIRAAIPAGMRFDPLMVLYLTDGSDPGDVRAGKLAGILTACKLYPAGATTNSHGGVTAMERIFPVLEAMQDIGLPLLVHGEVTEPSVDVFDREKVFLDRHLLPISERFPDLRIVFEHITTAEAAQFVLGAREGIAATITPQHLLMNRNDLFTGGLRPHHYCLPVLKRRTHQEALQKVAVSGSPRFFLGTDSAPHARHAKENACGCAGCYSAPAALPLYAEFFDRAGALDKLEGFASHYGADFYRLPRNTAKITLKREPWTVPERYDYLDGDIVPFWAGRELQWRVAE